MKSRSCSRGFTLIEIMVVVALIAILAAIALPAYNNYIARSKIKTAQADLVALSLNFENMYQRKLSYSPTGAVNTTTALETEFRGWNPASNSSDFTFSATMGTPAAGYTVTATGASGGVNGCAITLTNEGDKAIATCSYASSGKWL